MKRLITLTAILAILSLFVSCKRTISYSSLSEAEEKLQNILNTDDENYLNRAEEFANELCNIILNDPATLDYSFPLLADEDILLYTSPDGCLRYYNLGYEEIGEDEVEVTVIQYRDSNGKTYAIRAGINNINPDGTLNKDIIDFRDDIYIDPSDIYYIIGDNGEKLYFVESIGTNTEDRTASLHAFKIVDGLLVPANVFPDGRSVYIIEDHWEDWSEKAPWYIGLDEIFAYDDELLSEVYLPKDKYFQSDKYTAYRYDGTKLYPVGDRCGLWLPESMRDYEANMITLWTDKCTVRVDRMPDGTFRYTAWNGIKTTDDTPDLCLSGRYDKTLRAYIFDNGGYRYIVTPISVTVKHGSKTLATYRPTQS